MNFNGTIQKIAPVPVEMLKHADQKLEQFKSSGELNFRLGDWERLDSYNNPKNFDLASIVSTEIIEYTMSQFPGHTLFGWSVSYLPASKTVVDHTDRMFFHRLAKRILVITSNTPDVLNWHYNRDGTRIPYILEFGNIYRLNTAYTHGLVNNSEHERRGIYFDVMPTVLYEKFHNHPDILRVILTNATGERHVF